MAPSFSVDDRETAPFLPANRQPPGYQTFRKAPPVSSPVTLWPFDRILRKWIWMAGLLVICLGSVSIVRQDRVQEDNGSDDRTGGGHSLSDSSDAQQGTDDPVWQWDHNVYDPPVAVHTSNRTELPISATTGVASDPPPASGRNLLLLQFSSSATDSWADITSRPNRAYARQWGRNYVLYRGNHDGNSDLDLSRILMRLVSNNANGLLLYYDAVILLPPDAIIVDLDYDLLELLPESKLLAMSDPTLCELPQNQVLLYNLRHPLAKDVSHQWQDALEKGPPPPAATACKGTQLLQQIILASNNSNNKKNLLADLAETNSGLVPEPTTPGAFCLKQCSLLPQSNDEIKMACLHTTADSVCYRYYPKCELL